MDGLIRIHHGRFLVQRGNLCDLGNLFNPDSLDNLFNPDSLDNRGSLVLDPQVYRFRHPAAGSPAVELMWVGDGHTVGRR
jgi:hypothetical protein